MHSWWHTNVKNFVGIFLKWLSSTVMAQNTSEKANILIICGQLSPLDAQRGVRGYPTIVNNIQPCPKRSLLMPLTHVGMRTDSTMCTAWLDGSVTVLLYGLPSGNMIMCTCPFSVLICYIPCVPGIFSLIRCLTFEFGSLSLSLSVLQQWSPLAMTVLLSLILSYSVVMFLWR